MATTPILDADKLIKHIRAFSNMNQPQVVYLVMRKGIIMFGSISRNRADEVVRCLNQAEGITDYSVKVVELDSYEEVKYGR